jgi:hypothetical protein
VTTPEVVKFPRRVLLGWTCYLLYFVGVSFQSGGIVHYSLDPTKYATLIVIGALIFVTGAIANDLLGTDSLLRGKGPGDFAAFIASSLLLSIGIGMIGGGIQHFTDIPGRAPLLIALGIVVSMVGYLGRFRPHHHVREVLGAVAFCAAISAPTFAGLHAYADTIHADPAGHSHDEEPLSTPSTEVHGEVGTTDEHTDGDHTEGDHTDGNHAEDHAGTQAP